MKKIIICLVFAMLITGCGASNDANISSTNQNKTETTSEKAKNKAPMEKETLEDILKDEKKKPDEPYKGEYNVKGMKIQRLDSAVMVKAEEDGDYCEQSIGWNEDGEIIRILVNQYIHVNKLECKDELIGKEINVSYEYNRVLMKELGYDEDIFSISDDIRKEESEQLNEYTEDMTIYINTTIPDAIGKNYREYIQGLLDKDYMSKQRYLRSIGK